MTMSNINCNSRETTHPFIALYYACDYLSMLKLKLIHIIKRVLGGILYIMFPSVMVTSAREVI